MPLIMPPLFMALSDVAVIVELSMIFLMVTAVVAGSTVTSITSIILSRFVPGVKEVLSKSVEAPRPMAVMTGPSLLASASTWAVRAVVVILAGSPLL